MDKKRMRELLDKAAQLAAVASDWNMTGVEINGESVSVYTLLAEFKAGMPVSVNVEYYPEFENEKGAT